MQIVQVVSVPLHHVPPLRQELGSVVGTTHLVPLAVCELAFDGIRGPEQAFIEDSGCNCPETVAGHSLVVTHAIQGVEQGVVRDVLARVETGEHVVRITVDRVQRVAGIAGGQRLLCRPT